MRTMPPSLPATAATAATAARTPAVTVASSVYERLRDDLLTGGIEPGVKLRIETICERYAAGKHASARSAEAGWPRKGLVVRHDQRGFTAAPVDLDELEALTRTRADIDQMALKDAMAHPSTQWEEQIVLALHRLSRTPRSAQGRYLRAQPGVGRLHREFHRSLIANCRSRWLRQFSEELADQAYRYRQCSIRNAYGVRDVHAEHAAVAEAVLAGDVELAVSLLTRHYWQTAEFIQAAAGRDD
ncbi:GntR family transcriptional regulator [Cupriavidus basilensis]